MFSLAVITMRYASKHPLVQIHKRSRCYIILFARFVCQVVFRKYVLKTFMYLCFGAVCGGALPHYRLQDSLNPHETLKCLFEPAFQQSGSRTLRFHRNGSGHDRSRQEASFLGGLPLMVLIGRNIGKYDSHDGYCGWIL